MDLVEKISSILDDAKTEDISIVDLKNKTSIADFFIIATCRSSRHADASAVELVRQLKNIGIKCPDPSGRPQCDWVIVDAGNIIIHLFKPEIRELYSLEKLWGMSFDIVNDIAT
jgi:ribosome-associated protein